MLDTVLFVLQCVGVASFAVTGTIVAIQKKLDIVGALVFALLTSFGGGMIRDIVSGNNIPRLFLQKDYYIMAAICIVICLTCFHLAFFPRIGAFISKHKHNFLLELSDAIGLSLFCVLGVESTATMVGWDAAPILLIFGGFITGVGGGMLRDICSAMIPSIFRKNVYLIPAVLGATLYTITINFLPQIACISIAVALIITIRLLAYFYKWNLPVHKHFE